MLEIIRHTFGLCGEPHINLFTILISGFGLPSVYLYIKFKLKSYDKSKS